MWALNENTSQVHERTAAGWIQIKPPATTGSVSIAVDTAGKPVFANCRNASCNLEVWNGASFLDAGSWPDRSFSGEFPSDMWMLGRPPQLLRGSDAGITVHDVRGVAPFGIYSNAGHVFLVVNRGILHRRP